MDTFGDQVDRLTLWRAHLAFVLGIILCAQASRAADMWIIHPNPDATVISWAAWLVLLLFFLMFASGLWHGARMRMLLNDEGSRANRQSAIITGFWVMLLVAIGFYAATYYVAIGARAALHVVVAMGVGVALIHYSRLERQALKE